MAENIRSLEAAGVPVTPGSIYSAHFSGLGTAITAYGADPNDLASSVFSRDAVDANPTILGGTIAEAQNFFDSKMQKNSGLAPNVFHPGTMNQYGLGLSMPSIGIDGVNPLSSNMYYTPEGPLPIPTARPERSVKPVPAASTTRTFEPSIRHALANPLMDVPQLTAPEFGKDVFRDAVPYEDRSEFMLSPPGSYLLDRAQTVGPRVNLGSEILLDRELDRQLSPVPSLNLPNYAPADQAPPVGPINDSRTRSITPGLALEYAAPPASYTPSSFGRQSNLVPSGSLPGSEVQPGNVGVLSGEYAVPVAAVTPMASSPHTGRQSPTGVLSREYTPSLGPLDSIDIPGSALSSKSRSYVGSPMPADTLVDVANSSIFSRDIPSMVPSSAVPQQTARADFTPRTVQTIRVEPVTGLSGWVPAQTARTITAPPAEPPTGTAIAVTQPNAMNPSQTARNTVVGGILGAITGGPMGALVGALAGRQAGLRGVDPAGRIGGILGGLAERAQQSGLLSGPLSGMQAPGQWMDGNFAQNNAFSTNPDSAIDPNTGWQSFTNQHGVTTLTGGLKAFPDDAQPMVSNAGIGGGPSAGKGG